MFFHIFIDFFIFICYNTEQQNKKGINMKKVTNLTLVAAVAVLALVGCGGGGGGDNYTAHPYDAPPISEADKAAYLNAVNQARSVGRTCGQYGFLPAVPPLTWNDAFYKAAYEHSEDMSISGVFEHIGSGTNSDWTANVQELGRASTPDDRDRNNGYTNINGGGENIVMGAGSLEIAFNTWLKSAGHCSLIMEDLKKGDFALARVGSYWTMEIGGE